MMRRIICLLMVIAIVSCSEKPKGPPRERLVPVITAKVVEQEVPIYIFAVGNTTPWNQADIKPQISGIIDKIHFDGGQFVRQGDMLFTIDPRPFQAVLDKAKANYKKDKASLELAEATLKRYGQLVKEDYVSKLNYDTYKTNVDTQKALLLTDIADIKTAQINLGYCYIKAPFDGFIGDRNLDEGNLVTAEQTLLTSITQVDPIQVRFGISQKDYQLFKSVSPRPTQVEVSLPAEEGVVYKGKLIFVDNKLSMTTGTIILKAEVPNPKGILWPGEFTKVKLRLKTVPNAFVMPLAALQYGQSGPYVYIVKEDMTVEARPLEILTKNEVYVAASKGFNAGETVVIDGQVNLRPGAKVAIKDDRPKEAK